MHTTLALPRGVGPVPLAPRRSISRRAPVRLICQAGTEQVEDAATSQAAAPPALPAGPVPYGEAGSPYAPGVDPRYYQGYPGAQGQAPRGQEYYMAPPPMGYYPPQPYQPPVAQEAQGGAPWWLWVGVGAIAANVFNKVQEFMRNPKTPQQMMAEMAMKQMMGAMGNAPGGMPGGMPPFPGAKPGAMPPFPGGASPFANMAAAAATGMPTVDVPASAPSSAAMPPSADKKGDKFSQRLSSEGRAAGAPSGAASADGSKPSLEVVEPTVKEPASSSTSGATSSSGSSSGGASSRRSFSFTDVSAEEEKAKAAAGAAAGAGAANPFAGFPGAGAAGGASSSGSAESGSVMTDMMEQMLRNPEMQKMLYPYLPEPMRNPQSIEWMLNNPEVKKQMATMFEQQGMMSPQMMEMMKQMDFSQDKVNKQFQELGLKPEDVISKVMANPELAAGFSNPKVQAAIMDISGNPMNIMKYQNDPEVMKVLEKVTEIFQPSVAPNMRQ